MRSRCIVEVLWAGLLLLVTLPSTPTHAQSNSDCRDTNVRCGRAASDGMCATNPAVLDACPLSCNNCNNINTQSLRPIIAQECGRGVPASSTNPNSGIDQQGSNDARATNTPGSLIRTSRAASPGPQQNTGAAAAGGDAPRTPENVEKVSVEDALCGATPITDRYLITTATCVFKHSIYSVRLGELDFSKPDEPNSQPRDYAIKRIIVHPDFNVSSPARYNDIALLETEETIIFNKLVFPFCLADRRPPLKTTVTGAGFGYVNETHQSPRLQEAELAMMSLENCENLYQKAGQGSQLQTAYPQLLQRKDVLCAGHPGRGPCKGDEGGPLFRDEEDGRRYLVGIASFTGTCGGETILPGVYVSAADHIQFIYDVVYGQ